MLDIEIFINRWKDSVTYINGRTLPFDANSPLITPGFLNVCKKRILRLIIATLPITDIELWIDLKNLFLKHLDLKQGIRDTSCTPTLSSYFNTIYTIIKKYS